jgi:penicillin amidase
MFSRNVPAFLISIVVLVIAILIFSVNITRIGLDSDYTEVESTNLKSEVNVYENFNGIPHIIANNEQDLFFAIGYYQAKDRLWQMDIMRRAAEGRLSEVFGEKTLNQDLFLRSLEMGKLAKKSLSNISDKSKEILESYSAGVNSFIKNNNDKLQFEFGALDYEPEEWKPYHSILIGKLMAFEMSFSFWSDYSLSEIAMKIGKDKARDFIPIDYETKTKSEPSLDNILLPELDSNFISSLISDFGRGYTGSNSWAISYKDDNEKHTILANDPHLPINLPSRWYQMHISSPNINVIGYAIPGNPSIIAGRNDSITWGITNVMADICDIYLVKKGKNDDFYIDENGKETEYEFVRDTISINGKEGHQYYRKRTKMSALLSESHIWNDNKSKNRFFKEFDICFDWVAKKESDEVKCLYNLNKADNYNEFRSALKDWNAPALVFNYADKTGKVAKLPVGNIPIRGKTDPSFINPYWDKEYRWNGYRSLIGVGEQKTDGDGFVVAANNNFYPDNIFISHNWEPDSRARRIDQLLSEKNFTTIRDFEFMQMDNYSPFAYDLVKLTLPTLSKVKDRLNEQEKKAFNKLLKWNFILSKDLNEPLIYNYFKRTLIEETIKDELGTGSYTHYSFLTNYPDRLIMQLLKSDNHILFDNIKTEKRENKEVIIFRSFRNAIKSLIDKYGIDGISNLTYGEVRKLKLNHLFGDNKFIGPAVNLKAVGLGGDNTTLFNTESRHTYPNNVIVSASMRFITDMSDSLVYMILPGGSSGDPMSSNYGDQVQLWLNGGYLKLNINKAPTNDFELRVRLTP